MNSKQRNSLSDKHVSGLLNAIDDLIQIKTLIRKIVPTYQLTPLQKEEFKESLGQLYEKLDPLFEEYLNVSSKIQGKKDYKQLLLNEVDKNTILLVSANSSKKVLKKMGFDPRNIIVTGGPIFFEDYKIINPEIPDQALQGIQKKCEKIFNELKSQDWESHDLLFIYEKDNKADNLIIEKIDRLKNIIDSEIELFELPDWDELKE